MTALLRPAPLSVEEYLEGEELAETKHEFIDGVVYAMAGGTVAHHKICRNALVSLSTQLASKPCESFGGEMKLRLELANETRFYYPDLSVICHEVDPDATFVEDPAVVVEVLSDSTRRTDLKEKREGYLSLSSLKVLLFLEQDGVHASCFRRSANGGFEQTQFIDLADTIALPEVEAELALADVYRGLPFVENG